jgi:hypothetical protein
MENIFIAYSRKDKDFVHRLDDALKKRGRNVWMDWEDVGPTGDWMRALYAAIEGSDTFVFVLSPDSLASNVCDREIAHAVANNKRIVPIVAREIDATSMPQSIATLNWIFCRESDDFEEAIDKLISALDTDLDWVHAHTRLLSRAIEWEAKGKDNTFLLRGDDLRSAEQWLVNAGDNSQRRPTSLQVAYIMASRATFTAVQSPMEPIQLAFFSYAHEDAEFALRLAKDLRAGGAAVWMDKLDIKLGQLWDRAIEDALAKCPQLLVILSPAAIESTNVMDEVSFALEERKTVLPIIHRQCKIPFRLRRLQRVDLTLNYDEGLGRLLETLGVATPGAANAAEPPGQP